MDSSIGKEKPQQRASFFEHRGMQMVLEMNVLNAGKEPVINYAAEGVWARCADVWDKRASTIKTLEAKYPVMKDSQPLTYLS